MECRKVISRLSVLLDDMLDSEQGRETLRHLDQCRECRREWDRLVVLQRKLRSLGRAPAPDYLHHLVMTRIEAERQGTWRASLQSAIEYQWSRIRSIEGLWYLTRLAGTAATCFFFLLISAAMTPAYFNIQGPAERGTLSPEARYQLVTGVLKNLGMTPVEAQKKPIGKSDPMIHDLYLLNFGQSASRTSTDDSFSVVTVIDRSGTVKISSVLEYPSDRSLLTDFNAMITSARCRPASQNGRAVDSHLVMNFSKVLVYD
jgi:hypothetical protein